MCAMQASHGSSGVLGVDGRWDYLHGRVIVKTTMHLPRYLGLEVIRVSFLCFFLLVYQVCGQNQ